ncbi:alpha/beta-hydrolase [Thozetella sp. PMI_491]|nr:alpha/beta-hydrolase [Thozetella sp. PMI_491]
MIQCNAFLAVFLAAAISVSGFRQEDFISPSFLAGRFTNAPAPIVDVGYGKYQGYIDSANGLNIYRGIRYAAPPKRWQLPQAPESRPEIVSQAVDDPPRCPQAPTASMPQNLDWEKAIFGNEDCLFLNVFSPTSAKKLPVLFWIHGGGYGAGSAASFDFSQISHRVSNGFVTVVIQYRLGAFGFASSEQIAKKGVPNVGLHDMRFALEWVQKHIESFGGDPSQVTIAGESAGGGSVMLMAMANGGKDGTRLFRRGIASSPYLPTQPKYNDGLPEDYYRQLAEKADCKGSKDSWFECLTDAGTIALQNASALTTFAAKYGNWAFIPVTDGTLIQGLPTEQLLKGSVNGERVLVGNNANEGTYFVPQNITTEAQFTSFVQLQYPGLSKENLTAVMQLYSVSNASASSTLKYDSDGTHAPFATEMSRFVAGWQQAANNLYAETTFVCPAYWLADAYAPDVNVESKGKSAWRYQFSVPDAFHGADLAPLTDNPAKSGTAMDSTFRTSFQNIWGRFIVNGDPTLVSSDNHTVSGVAAAGAAAWKPWGAVGAADGRGYSLLDLNVTSSAPQTPDWRVVDGAVWEGGRGARCALWAALGTQAQT